VARQVREDKEEELKYVLEQLSVLTRANSQGASDAAAATGLTGAAAAANASQVLATGPTNVSTASHASAFGSSTTFVRR
jgi:hypothetical protein